MLRGSVLRAIPESVRLQRRVKAPAPRVVTRVLRSQKALLHPRILRHRASTYSAHLSYLPKENFRRRPRTSYCLFAESSLCVLRLITVCRPVLMMVLSAATPAILVASIAIIIYQVIVRVRFRRKFKFPPSPPGKPLVGNMLDVPWPAGMWGVDLANKYGEMQVYPRLVKALLVSSWCLVAY